MHTNFCPEHGSRLTPQTVHGGDHPKVIFVCLNCQRDANEQSDHAADRERAYECDHGGRS